MPDTNRLRIGDRIRILRVPEADLRQREREIVEGTEMAGWTADTIERIIESQPIVTISRIDEYGSVWYAQACSRTLAGRLNRRKLVILKSRERRLISLPDSRLDWPSMEGLFDGCN
jgi:hypothetical protein